MVTLDSLVKDKDVLLVGNSSVLNNLKMGRIIDSYECVIRFNLAIAHLNRETTGIKTDIWIFAMKSKNVCRNVYRQSKYKPNICIRYGINKPVDEIPYVVFDIKEQKRRMRDLLGIRDDQHPSTGVVTMSYLIDHCLPSRLSYIGFDSFSSTNFYTSADSNKINQWHDNNKEAQFIAYQQSKEHIRKIP